MREQDIISAPCFLIFSFLYFYVQATDDAFVKIVEYDFTSKRVGETSPALRVDSNEEDYSRKICQLPKRKGFCIAFTKRYYYDGNEERCKLFTYGGCFGNENNFKTYRECKRRCERQGKNNIIETKTTRQPQVPAFCYAPAYPSSCDTFVLRYFHNMETGRCEEFVFGGCNAKRNNFYTLAECQAVCQPRNSRPSELEELCLNKDLKRSTKSYQNPDI